jgi:adenosine deaminase
MDAVIEEVLAGFEDGSAGTDLTIRAICSAMRQTTRSLEVAEAAVAHRDDGVVAFDIAGPEDGFPPDDHLPAFQYCQRENFHITIHAGEAYGPRSIWKAVQWCNAERLGHGIRIVEDIQLDGAGEQHLGRLASLIRDRRIPLEVCPTSNVNTGVVDRIEDHPIALLIELRFRVTVNTDNRLMSGVTMSSEMAALVDAFGYGWDRLRWLTVNAMKSSFLPFRERLQIIEQVIKPRYAPLEAWATEPPV